MRASARVQRAMNVAHTYTKHTDQCMIDLDTETRKSGPIVLGEDA